MGCESSRIGTMQPLQGLTSLVDGSDKGIIPLTCEELFRRLDEKRSADGNIDFRVEVSYIEVSPGCLTSFQMSAGVPFMGGSG